MTVEDAGEGAAQWPVPPMETVARLLSSVDALAALAAHLRVEAGTLDVDPAIGDLLARVATTLVGDTRALPDQQRVAIIAMARAFTYQAAELIEHPERAPGWEDRDEILLQSIGMVSMGIAEAVRAAGGLHTSLGALLGADGATFVDVGTGTAWLAIALARAFPRLRVVGIDIFPPALDLARQNVTATGLDDRVELRLQDATTLDPGSTDVIWLPMPFLPLEVVPAVLDAAVLALRPGGWLLAGTFPGPGDTLPEQLMALRTLRSGGHPWIAQELCDRLRDAGLGDVGEIPPRWPAPVRLYAGRTELT